MSEKTATQINVEEIERRRVYELLSTNQVLQSEAIVNHYLAHAHLAAQIKNLIEYRRYSLDLEADEVISHGIEEIKRNHMHSFGIPLEWPKQ